MSQMAKLFKSKACRKYLENFSDPFSELRIEISNTYARGLVIPASNEGSFFLDFTLPSLQKAQKNVNGKTLVILVVNERANASLEVKSNNSRLLKHFHAESSIQKLHTLSEQIDLLIVNVTGVGALQEKEGVGRARKIGADIFLKLASLGIIENAFFAATDADVIFASDYLSFLDSIQTETAALVNVPFQHFYLPTATSSEIKAIQNYDFYLRYFERALKFSGTLYAYPNIGSSQFIYAPSYAEVRGYPNLQAGEDFYIATKLAKVGSVRSPKLSTKIFLSGRVSDRVPFGTGISVSKISEALEKKEEYKIYHPYIFRELKKLLEELSLSVIYRSYEIFLQNLKSKLESFETMLNFFESIQLRNKLEQLWRMSASESITLKHIDNFFDAFVILKFVHFYKDKALPSLNISEAIPLFARLQGDFWSQKPPEVLPWDLLLSEAFGQQIPDRTRVTLN